MSVTKTIGTTNRERAERAKEIVADYADPNREGGPVEDWFDVDLETNVSDLLADLNHLVRLYRPRVWRRRWDSIVSRAEMHHDAERGQGNGWDTETHA